MGAIQDVWRAPYEIYATLFTRELCMGGGHSCHDLDSVARRFCDVRSGRFFIYFFYFFNILIFLNIALPLHYAISPARLRLLAVVVGVDRPERGVFDLLKNPSRGRRIFHAEVQNCLMHGKMKQF